ncbi:hypothetical protein EUTSA_v10014734mg [Eutrema salsugineum]|uniref:C2 domain-containing protein n=1 Tax=Eutrema salsugineum TaxID=72664 RepID=V4LEW9_EUTSA|nr:uncharacterized protein LOC18019125 [Eutrema salsugineum]ESQ40967.1 hypothetical protein EUTSA_v10014734mg [Eutrema salsugineum]
MGIVRNLCSIKFEVKIVEARNVELKSSPSSLFVRFYLYAGSNRKIELNTAGICSRSDHEAMIWNQSFGLECQGNETAVEELKQESVVFELRRRKTGSFLRKWSRSELVGRGEISWKDVTELDGMETERFVVMGETKDRILEDCNKPLLLKIALKVQASKSVNIERVEDLCGCRDCRRCNCLDYEAFVVACTLAGI